MSDLELIALWEQWKQSFAEELACETAQTTARTRMIEQRIAEAPAEGLVGIAIKLTLWRLTNSHKDAAAVQAEAAYCDVIGLVGRDFSAEAEVIAERLSPAMSPSQ
jgi:hypothetical protein